jgi:glycosyltransferase involved in cell wall biosynthesis
VHFSPDLFVAAWSAKFAKCPFVVMTRHVAEPWGKGKAKLYDSWLDHIVPVSDAVERVLIEDGIPSHKVTVAKAGCPIMVSTVSRQTSRQELGFCDFTPGTFGRLEPEKGIDLAIRAASSSGLSLAVFGDGSVRSRLEAMNQKVGRPATFYGQRDNIAEPMNAVDVVVIPSRWAEAFPFAALEAMSLGRALVVARTGGLPEMVEHGVNGLTFERENSEDLAAQLNLLKSDEWLVQQLGDNGRERHAQEFTIPKMAERIDSVYETLLAS